VASARNGNKLELKLEKNAYLPLGQIMSVSTPSVLLMDNLLLETPSDQLTRSHMERLSSLPKSIPHHANASIIHAPTQNRRIRKIFMNMLTSLPLVHSPMKSMRPSKLATVRPIPSPMKEIETATGTHVTTTTTLNVASASHTSVMLPTNSKMMTVCAKTAAFMRTTLLTLMPILTEELKSQLKRPSVTSSAMLFTDASLIPSRAAFNSEADRPYVYEYYTADE